MGLSVPVKHTAFWYLLPITEYCPLHCTLHSWSRLKFSDVFALWRCISTLIKKYWEALCFIGVLMYLLLVQVVTINYRVRYQSLLPERRYRGHSRCVRHRPPSCPFFGNCLDRMSITGRCDKISNETDVRALYVADTNACYYFLLLVWYKAKLVQVWRNVDFR
jgi:hypothetical protein